jgi:hypothetical protein
MYVNGFFCRDVRVATTTLVDQNPRPPVAALWQSAGLSCFCLEADNIGGSAANKIPIRWDTTHFAVDGGTRGR